MELLKKLTGKNPAEYEPVAKQLVEKPDLQLFKELVARDDYMFGFIKQNVAKRIFDACNETNYQNLYQFLPYYSPYYEDVIVSLLSRYDAQNAAVKMLELLISGGDDEKCYAAKYFVQNPEIIFFQKMNTCRLILLMHLKSSMMNKLLISGLQNLVLMTIMKHTAV